MANFPDKTEFHFWLMDRCSRDEVVCLAARAALRAMPVLLLDLVKHPENFSSAQLLPIFRANLTSWVAVFDSTPAAAAVRVNDTPRMDVSDLSAVSFAARRAAVLGLDLAQEVALPNSHRDSYEYRRTAVLATDIAVQGIRAGAGADACATAWQAVSIDATLLEGGTSPQDLCKSPLWSGGAAIPETLLTAWSAMKTLLTERSTLFGLIRRRNLDDWQVWTDWYDARLHGDGFNTALETERLFLDNSDLWKERPAVVNRSIRELITRYDTIETAKGRA